MVGSLGKEAFVDSEGVRALSEKALLVHAWDRSAEIETRQPSRSLKFAYKALSTICLLLIATWISITTFHFSCYGIRRVIHHGSSSPIDTSDPFRWGPCEGIEDKHFKCGHLNVPLDYTNKSDPRTVRLAVNLYQAGNGKAKQTIIINPGGPGGSGVQSLFSGRGEYISQNLTKGDVDVLGFDPRGVNMSEPGIGCFPNDAFRDRWNGLASQFYETGLGNPLRHLQLADSMAEATMKACLEQWGDIPRFLSTAFVARDINAIREALGEEEIWGYMVSYGSGIGTHLSQLFPDKIGRLMLDGLEFVKDHRLLGGFGWTVSAERRWSTSNSLFKLNFPQLQALDNVTDAWNDGFLGECVKAGPDRCALATTVDGTGHLTTVESLSSRMKSLFDSILHRPIPAHTPLLGPGIVTYEYLIKLIYESLYNPYSWPGTATMLAQLERGDATSAFEAINSKLMFNLTASNKRLSTDELGMMVICADAFDAPPQPIEWWLELQANMTIKSFISGNDRLFNVLPCRHFNWNVAEVKPPAPVNRVFLLMSFLPWYAGLSRRL